MPIILWSEKLSVGISMIDSHHQVLIDYINLIHEANRTGKAELELNGLLEKLIDYTGYHFTFEENLMDQNAYPGTLVHKSAHTALISQIKDLKGKLNKGQSGLSIHVINFLKDWLTNHILGEDKKFCAYLVRKGLQ
jgi:hemerythrin